MNISLRRKGIAVSLLVSLALLSGCGAQAAANTQAPAATANKAAPAATSPAASTEQPVAPEQNPVGDIPDNQAFVTYKSSAGYTLDVPEGWARTEQGGDVGFVSTFNAVRVNITPATTAPTAKSAQNTEVPALVAAGRAVSVSDVQDATLPGGTAVKIVSTANSAPDAVTNKQVRLEQNTYLFFNNGKLATLTMEAPQGADNVDQWKRIAESFRWQ